MKGKNISHYKILEKLGEGGMGVVYKAEDTKLKRIVALKFLSPQAIGTDEDKARFVHEAQAAAALTHSNICTVHEIDEKDDQAFIAMECVEGQSLKQTIASGPMQIDEAMDLAEEADVLVEGMPVENFDGNKENRRDWYQKKLGKVIDKLSSGDFVGALDLVEVIQQKHAEFHKNLAWEEERDWKGAVKRFDRRWLGASLYKTYSKILARRECRDV